MSNRKYRILFVACWYSTHDVCTYSSRKWCVFEKCLMSNRKYLYFMSPTTYIHTYLPTYLPTYPPTHLPTYLPILIVHANGAFLKNVLCQTESTSILCLRPHTYIHTYLPTYLLTHLPTYPPTYLPTYTYSSRKWCVFEKCLMSNRKYLYFMSPTTYIHTYIHTYIPTYLLTYLPTYLPTYLT